MDLVHRYLLAVRFWLPRQKHDILAELSEDLRSEIDERQGALGRPLTEAELAALLKRRGDPMTVANRFLPQRQLIGPALFPVYWLVLKLLAACCVAIWTLPWLARLAFVPGYRAAHPGFHLLDYWQGLWVSGFFAFGAVTALFAVLDRTGTAAKWREKWDPRKLPAERDPNRIPRSSSVTEMATGALFFALGTQMPAAPSFDGDGTRVALAGAWPTIYGMLLALVLAGVALAGVNLFRPYWTRLRAGIQLALHAAGLVPAALALRSGGLIEVTSTRLSPGRIAALSRLLNTPVRVAVIAAVLIVVGSCIWDVVRLSRVGRPAAEPV